MGDEAKEPTFEDSKIISTIPSRGRSLLGKRAWDDFSSQAGQYTEKYGTWGFKYPSIHSHLFKINNIIENPKYIFVYRDIFSISNRRSGIFSSVDQFNSMKNCLRLYSKTIDFLEKEKPASLHVSYEKMLTNTEKYAAILAEFCELSASEETLQNVVKSVMPSPEIYKSWSESHKQALGMGETKYRGSLDVATAKQVRGWASNLEENVPVSVSIVVNGVFHGKAQANESRPDVMSSGITETASVGFQYDFDVNPPTSDDVITVFIADTNIEIINSGKRIS
jgi:hypothetical protein